LKRGDSTGFSGSAFLDRLFWIGFSGSAFLDRLFWIGFSGPNLLDRRTGQARAAALKG